MKNFERIRTHPYSILERMVKPEYLDYIKSYIIYDPKVNLLNKQYRRMTQSSHDGTFLFSLELLEDALISLIEKQSYWVKEPYKEEYKDIIYYIGDVYTMVIYKDRVNLPCGDCPGQRERVIIPVIVEWVK